MKRARTSPAGAYPEYGDGAYPDQVYLSSNSKDKMAEDISRRVMARECITDLEKAGLCIRKRVMCLEFRFLDEHHD